MCWLSTRPAQTRRQVASLEQTSGNCYEAGLTNNHVMVGEEPTDFQMSFTDMKFVTSSTSSASVKKNSARVKLSMGNAQSFFFPKV